MRVWKEKDMNKKAYQDGTLSLKAKGVLAIIESLGGKATRSSIAECCLEQRYGISSALIELKARGLIEAVNRQDAAGRFSGTFYKLKAPAGNNRTEKKEKTSPEPASDKLSEQKESPAGEPKEAEFDLGDEVFISMVYGSRNVDIPRSFVDSMKNFYPDIDVEQSIRNAAAFATSHQKRYAHNKAWKPYLTNWLKTDTQDEKMRRKTTDSYKSKPSFRSMDVTDQYEGADVGVML